MYENLAFNNKLEYKSVVSEPVGTNFNNDNNGPYADAIHFNTYSDFSGGKQNLLMLKKTGIGMRIYQNHNDFDRN